MVQIRSYIFHYRFIFQPRYRKSKSWLDIGCHNLSFLRIVSRSYSISTTGIDTWRKELKGAEDRNIEYISKNLLTDDWSAKEIGKQFSIISGLEVIEHIIDTDRFIENCYGLLENNGILILSTPNINSLRNRIAIPFGAYPAGLEYRTVVHHVRLYNPTALQEHLAKFGFTVEKIIGVNFLPAKWLGKLNKLDEFLANLFPSLCGNFIVIARKP